MSPEKSARLAALLEKHLEGALLDEEIRELRGLLEESPEALDLYFDMVDLHADLARRFAAAPVAARVRRGLWFAVAAAAACVAVTALAVHLIQPRPIRETVPQEARAPHVAPPRVVEEPRITETPVEEPVPVPPPEGKPEEPKAPEPPVRPETPATLPFLPIPPPEEKPPAPPQPLPAPRKATEVFIARVSSVRGDAQSEGGPARAGQELKDGAAIITGKRASVTVEFPDATQLELGPGTELARLSASGKGRICLVRRGTIRATVARQPVGAPMVFLTPAAEARVLGTRLSLEVDPEETQLEVYEGRVRLVRAADKRATDVVAGHFAVAGAGTEPAARPLPPVEEVFLRPSHGELLGPEWVVVPDPQAPSKEALEAAQPCARGRDDLRRSASYVAFTFRADSGRPYFLWVRGKCTAAAQRLRVAAELPEARFNRRCPFVGPTGLSGVLFDGYGEGQGYGWLSGGPEAQVPVVVRFTRPGWQTLRLHAVEAPLRIDGVRLSTTKKTRPDAST